MSCHKHWQCQCQRKIVSNKVTDTEKHFYELYGTEKKKYIWNGIKWIDDMLQTSIYLIMKIISTSTNILTLYIYI